MNNIFDVTYFVCNFHNYVWKLNHNRGIGQFQFNLHKLSLKKFDNVI